MTRPAPPPPPPPGLSALVLMGSSFFTAPLPRVPSLDFAPRTTWTFILRLLSAASLFFLPRRPSFSWLENKLKPFFCRRVRKRKRLRGVSRRSNGGSLDNSWTVNSRGAQGPHTPNTLSRSVTEISRDAATGVRKGGERVKEEVRPPALISQDSAAEKPEARWAAEAAAAAARLRAVRWAPSPSRPRDARGRADWGRSGGHMFPLFHTPSPPSPFLLSPATLSSLSPSPQFFGHLHPSINCQCSSTAINQLFVSSCQSACDLCQLLLLITRRVRLEGEKGRGRERWRESKEETKGEPAEGERGAASWDGVGVALRKRMKERKRGSLCQENE